MRFINFHRVAKYSILSICLAFLSGTADADPVFDWSGAYIGVHGGGGWGNRRWEQIAGIYYFGLVGPVVRDVPVNGGLAGGQIGFNYQSGRWVLGVQADLAWTDLSGSQQCSKQLATPFFVCLSNAEWLASGALRAGYTFDRALVYAKGGLALMREKYNLNRGDPKARPFNPYFETHDTAIGYVVGAGVEYALFSNWSTFVEYNYYNFGSNEITVRGKGIIPPVLAGGIKVEPDMHVAKAGINYRFNSLTKADEGGARTFGASQAYFSSVYNWQGFYVGAHIGGTFIGDNGVAVLLGKGVVSSNRSVAFLGGGQAGYNYQFARTWLIGIEGDIGGLSKISRTFTGPFSHIFSDRSDWLASVTGRLGYTIGQTLVYAKGGIVFRDDNGLTALYNGGSLAFSASRNGTGYTVGGGLEHMFAPAWSAKIEYQYYNFDTTTVVSANGGPSFRYTHDLHTAKVGVNYHLN